LHKSTGCAEKVIDFWTYCTKPDQWIHFCRNDCNKST